MILAIIDLTVIFYVISASLAVGATVIFIIPARQALIVVLHDCLPLMSGIRVMKDVQSRGADIS